MGTFDTFWSSWWEEGSPGIQGATLWEHPKDNVSFFFFCLFPFNPWYYGSTLSYFFNQINEAYCVEFVSDILRVVRNLTGKKNRRGHLCVNSLSVHGLL